MWHCLLSWTNVSKQQNKTHVALLFIMNEGNQRAKKKDTWHYLLTWTKLIKEQNKKHMWHCLLSWRNVNKGQSKKTHGTVCYHERM
jgi:hypothetical protein